MMRRLVVAAMAVGMFSIGLAGCAEKAKSKKETTVTTPGGETTITTEKEVKRSGDNPPPAP